MACLESCGAHQDGSAGRWRPDSHLLQLKLSGSQRLEGPPRFGLERCGAGLGRGAAVGARPCAHSVTGSQHSHVCCSHTARAELSGRNGVSHPQSWGIYSWPLEQACRALGGAAVAGVLWAPGLSGRRALGGGEGPALLSTVLQTMGGSSSPFPWPLPRLASGKCQAHLPCCPWTPSLAGAPASQTRCTPRPLLLTAALTAPSAPHGTLSPLRLGPSCASRSSRAHARGASLLLALELGPGSPGVDGRNGQYRTWTAGGAEATRFPPRTCPNFPL